MAKTDKKTMDLIQEVARRKAAIAKAERPNWRTNMSFSFSEKLNDALNLNTVADVKTLISMAAFVRDREVSYKQTAEFLKVAEVPAFTWMGYSATDWLEDIKARIDKIQLVAARKKLETLESRLSTIISPELRAQLELEAIEKELGA